MYSSGTSLHLHKDPLFELGLTTQSRATYCVVVVTQVAPSAVAPLLKHSANFNCSAPSAVWNHKQKSGEDFKAGQLSGEARLKTTRNQLTTQKCKTNTTYGLAGGALARPRQYNTTSSCLPHTRYTTWEQNLGLQQRPPQQKKW